MNTFRNILLSKAKWYLLPCLWFTSLAAYSQQASLGNTTVFGGAQMTFFGNHSFLAGSGTQAGIILTERTTGNLGIVNFSGTGITTLGASDLNHVDGYVRKIGAGQFVFPVGDNGNLGPFAASADGTTGAYFHADPNTSITSNVFTGSNYPALPGGAPFATTSKGSGVGTISTIEYWHIQGSNATPITLTWDAASDVSTLTQNDLSKLTLVGWNPVTSLWELIPAVVDATSILGGASVLTSGSITTTQSLLPSTYTVYTLSAAAPTTPDLRPYIIMPNVAFTTAVTSLPFTARIRNVRTATTASSLITIRLYKPTSSSVITLTGTSASDWTIVPSGTYYTLTSNVDIPASALGYSITANVTIDAATSTGNYPLRVFIPDLSGGEVLSDNINNNLIVQVFKN